MNLDDTKKRVQKYLNSNKRYPLIVDVQTREDLANIAEYFKVGSNKFPAIEEFCNQDEAIKLDIALLICGVKNNDYLKLALNKTSKSSELIKNIFRSVLDIDWKSENYQKLYRQRKSLISELKKPLPETIDFCKILSTKGEDEIYYLTDLTQPEKEKIIKWLSNYGVKYSKDELVSILMNVYPDLAYYLSSYRYRNEFLNTYFENYKYQKITNRILPSFDKVVEEQAIKMDFVTILKPRTAYVDKLDTQNAQVFFVDAMGVEYLSFIQQKCSEYGLSAKLRTGALLPL